MASILRNRTVLNSIIIGLMLAFSMQITTNVLFYHTHTLENGIVVAHAHPYDKSADGMPAKQHTHTFQQIFFLDSTKIAFIIAFVFFILLVSYYFIKVPLESTLLPGTGLTFSRKGRAPPVSLFQY